MNIQKYWKNILTQFLEISRALTLGRILQKPGFYYISFVSGLICPKFGIIHFLISIGTWMYKNIKKKILLNFWKFLVYWPLKRILWKLGFYYINSNSGYIYPKFGRILFLISIGTWIYKNIEKIFLLNFRKFLRLLTPRENSPKTWFLLY